MITIETELDNVKLVLDVITKTAPPPSGNVVFKCEKGQVVVTSVADLSRCQVRLTCTGEGEGEFAIPLQSLKDAVQGRAKLTLAYKEGTLTISSGRYRTQLSTVDVIPMDNIPEEENATTWKLTTDQGTWLKDALKKVALKPTSLFSTWMPAGIKITSKGAFVACYDDQHLSWIKDKSITGELSCLLPMDVLQSVMDVFHTSSFRITQSRAFVRVSNSQIKLVLNTPAADDIRPVEEIIEKVKSASSADGVQFTVAKSDLVEYLANARSVVGKERAEIELSVAEGKKRAMKVTIKTVQGTSEALLGFTGSLEQPLKVDHDYFSELVSKCADEVCVSVVESAFLSVKLKETTALVALNQ